MYLWWFLIPLFIINTDNTCKALQAFALLQLFPNGFPTSGLGMKAGLKHHHINMDGGCGGF